jgi:hypothetical protein
MAYRRRADLNTRWLVALLTGALLSVGSLACGRASPHATQNSRTTSGTTAAADRRATTGAADAGSLGRHLFGDYDNDDGAYVVRESDGDPDDAGNNAPGKDGDSDGGGSGQYDGDDESVRDFGREAPPADRRAIVALVKSYYTAAVAGDGAKACSLFFSPLARTYPKDLAEGSTRPYLRGLTTCATVASKLFEQYHTQLSNDIATLKVADVRLAGKLGLAVLSFKGLPWRQVEVMREHRVWKMFSLLDSELP